LKPDLLSDLKPRQQSQTEGYAIFSSLRPLPGGRRLAAARTGVSDCADFAPNYPQPRSSSRAGLLPPSPLRTVRESFPSHGSSLSNACLTRRGNDTNKEATVEPNTSKKSQTIRGRSGRTSAGTGATPNSLRKVRLPHRVIRMRIPLNLDVSPNGHIHSAKEPDRFRV
jgi:hypothetical protein